MHSLALSSIVQGYVVCIRPGGSVLWHTSWSCWYSWCLRPTVCPVNCLPYDFGFWRFNSRDNAKEMRCVRLATWSDGRFQKQNTGSSVRNSKPMKHTIKAADVPILFLMQALMCCSWQFVFDTRFEYILVVSSAVYTASLNCHVIKTMQLHRVSRGNQLGLNLRTTKKKTLHITHIFFLCLVYFCLSNSTQASTVHTGCFILAEGGFEN